jgi:N-terminal domain of CBF1 interacting co-repressor CIR
MVQGLAFLSKKGFNPQNQSNQKRVWEAEQAAKNEKERLRKRQEQLQREQEEEELERVTKGDIGGSQAQLRFMYDAPPGLNKDNKQEDKQDDKKPAAAVSNESASSSTLDQLARANTGDDAAAEAFRRMLASSVQNENDGKDHDDDDEGQNDAEPSFRFAPVLLVVGMATRAREEPLMDDRHWKRLSDERIDPHKIFPINNKLSGSLNSRTLPWCIA